MFPVITLLGTKIYSYPLLVGMAWATGYIISHYLNRRQERPLRRFDFLFFYLFLFGFMGAKLVFLLTSSEYVSLLTNSSFWLGGGFVFYGGAIFAGLCLYLYKHFFKVKIKDFYCLLPALCFAHAVGRIGCFLAGCCYGEKTHVFWNVYLHGAHRHPTQIYESFFLFLLGSYLYREFVGKKGALFLKYLIGYASWRFFVEFFRGDLVRGIYAGLSLSQYISIVLLLGAFVTLFVKGRVLRRD